jgi:phosphonate transport system substrate-binding protein
MKKLISAILIFTAVLVFTGCHDKTKLNVNGIPEKLIIAHYNGGDNPEGVRKALELLRVYFEKKLGVEVQFIYTTDYTSVIEALRAKKAHMAYLSPFSYVLASQKHDITPIITLGENGSPHMYHSTIIASIKSGINNIADLKAKAKQLTLCFADPASTSGHLIPTAYLNTIGLNPEHAFKETMFAGSHVASVLSVASGKIDIGCTATEYGVNLLQKKGLVKPGQFKVLWQSDPIVSSPIVVRNDLNKDFVKKIQDLYLNLAKDEPAIFLTYLKLSNTKPDNLAYMTVQDSMYNGIRKIAGGIKDLSVIK